MSVSPETSHWYTQIPIVDAELRKAAGEEGPEIEGKDCPEIGIAGYFDPFFHHRSSEGGGERPSSMTLVTAAGTYATQSAFTATTVKKEEKM